MTSNKIILFTFIFLILFSCKKKEKHKSSEENKVNIDSIVKTDTLWQDDIGITYYIDTANDMMYYTFVVFIKDDNRIIFTDSFTTEVYYFGEIKFIDINFDNLIDIDIVSFPANRSGANEIHDICLKNKTNMIIIEDPNLSFYYLDKSKKLVYTVYNGGHSMTFYKQKWQDDSLICLEEVDIEENFEEETSTYNHYFFRDTDTVKQENRIYKRKDIIKLPKDFDSIALYGLY